MIEAFRNEEIVLKVGGHFKLSALIQRRWLEFIQGARPMIDAKGMTDMEIIVEEIMQDKIVLEELPEFAADADGDD